MHDPRPDSLPEDGSRFSQRKLFAAVLLFTLTLAVGVSARLGARTEDPGDRVVVAGTPEQVALEAHLDRSSVLEGGDGLARIELVLRGGDTKSQAKALPTDLVVVLDRSGSMQGQPLETAKAAIRDLVDRLGPDDRFALVSYADDARIDRALAGAGDQRARFAARLDAMLARGGTAMSAGLDAAHRLVRASSHAGRTPRVIVLSDGHANQGDATPEGLHRRAARALEGEYVLSAVGIGGGFDETVMSSLADAGTGNFYYLPDLGRLAGIFADEFASARETVARALRVDFTPSDGVELKGASGYPLDRAGDAIGFHPGDLFAGQERRIWLSLQAPTGSPGEIVLGAIEVFYTDLDGTRTRIAMPELPALACVENEQDFYASFDKPVYQRAVLSDEIGNLKRKLGQKMASGEQAEAVAELKVTRERLELGQLRALGYLIDGSTAELDALEATLHAPEAASPSESRHLGKALLESGRDDQRAGAKR